MLHTRDTFFRCLPSLFFLVLSFACGPQVENDVPASPPTVEVPSAPQSSPDDEAATDAAFDAGRFLAGLQGTWQRTSYPNGTVVFRGMEVKWVAGEGAAEPPSFRPFELADVCPYTLQRENVPANAAFIAYDDKTCEKLTLLGDRLVVTLQTPDGEDAGEITYERQGEKIEDGPGSEHTRIPGSIRGIWAKTTGECSVRNQNRISIDDSGIQYFEATAMLERQRERSSTRVMADFSYRTADPDASPLQYIISLDVQDNGQRLILREYQSNAQAGPIAYLRCQ